MHYIRIVHLAAEEALASNLASASPHVVGGLGVAEDARSGVEDACGASASVGRRDCEPAPSLQASY